MSTLLWIFSTLIRTLVLIGIVFIITSKIPTNPIETKNKLTISVTVVLIFAIIEYIFQFSGVMKNFACHTTCGSTDASTTVYAPGADDILKDIDFSAPMVDSELEEAIKSLNITSNTNKVLGEEQQSEIKDTNKNKSKALGEEINDTPLPAEAEGFANYATYRV